MVLNFRQKQLLKTSCKSTSGNHGWVRLHNEPDLSRSWHTNQKHKKTSEATHERPSAVIVPPLSLQTTAFTSGIRLDENYKIRIVGLRSSPEQPVPSEVWRITSLVQVRRIKGPDQTLPCPLYDLQLAPVNQNELTTVSSNKIDEALGKVLSCRREKLIQYSKSHHISA